jgi:hypothetical protein
VQGKTGIEFIIHDQTKDPYFLDVTVDEGTNDLEVVMTDLKTNQSSGFSGSYDASGKISGTLIVQHAGGDDDIISVTCQR